MTQKKGKKSFRKTLWLVLSEINGNAEAEEKNLWKSLKFFLEFFLSSLLFTASHQRFKFPSRLTFDCARFLTLLIHHQHQQQQNQPTNDDSVAVETAWQSSGSFYYPFLCHNFSNADSNCPLVYSSNVCRSKLDGFESSHAGGEQLRLTVTNPPASVGINFPGSGKRIRNHLQSSPQHHQQQ